MKLCAILLISVVLILGAGLVGCATGDNDHGNGDCCGTCGGGDKDCCGTCGGDKDCCGTCGGK